MDFPPEDESSANHGWSDSGIVALVPSASGSIPTPYMVGPKTSPCRVPSFESIINYFFPDLSLN